jgi:hypothetical protein
MHGYSSPEEVLGQHLSLTQVDQELDVELYFRIKPGNSTNTLIFKLCGKGRKNNGNRFDENFAG